MTPARLLALVLACLAVSGPAPAAPASPTRPNVLLICVDDLKPLLGCYGDSRVKSPNLDRLAARGVRFDLAYCNQAVCAPSRNALLTGRRSTSLGIYDLATNFRRAAPDAVTLPQYFKTHGWRTEGLGKVFHVGHGNHEDPASWSVPHWRPRLSGLGGGYALPANRGVPETREEARFANSPESRAARLPRGAATEAAEVPDDTYADGQIANEAIRRLRASRERPEEPFLLAVGFHKPHLPFVAPKKYWDLYRREDFEPARRRTPPDGAPPFAPTSWGELRQYSDVPETGPLTADLERQLIHGYHAAVSYMDAQLGRVLDELDRLALSAGTIVVLWGDHGWHLGDHGQWCKHTNYEEAARIPILVVAPGVTPAGRSCRALAESVDLYPTLAELAGLPIPAGLDGTSLVPALRDPINGRTKEAVFHAFPRSPRGLGDLIGRAVRTERHRLVEWKRAGARPDTAILELYDYQADPGETRNLAADQPDVVAGLRRILDAQPEARPQFRAAAAAVTNRFENLGVPVTKAMLMATAVGPDATGTKELLYFDFAQTGATLFLVAVDPDTGEARQYQSPVGPGAWALIRGPDDKMYLGTWESGYILEFDPTKPDKGIQVIGKPSTTETYIWQYAIGKDGKLYGCTYGQAKLVSYDPRTRTMEDLGRMDDTQMYTRSVAAGPNGKIYTAVGYGRANVVVYDPATRTHRSILPDAFRSENAAAVHRGADGQVYATCGTNWFRADDETLVPIPPAQVVSTPPLALRDGRRITVGEITATTGSFVVTDPKTGASRTNSFEYRGDGSLLFVLGNGPGGTVYGSTAMPLEMFAHDPATGKSRHLGNPTSVNGELYSLLPWKDRLYVCAYPGGYLSVYDPRQPFRFGTAPTDNPRGFGPLGDGHLRPRAMTLGPDDTLYVGSLPPYGQLGGALAAFDLGAEKVVANHRHLVTNQSIVSLAWEPGSRLLFGGSAVTGGGGTTPTEKEARFFAYDPATRTKVFEASLVPGLESYPALCAVDNRVYIAARNRLLVFDPVEKKVLRSVDLPGTPLEISLGRHRDGRLVGLTPEGVFVVDPATDSLVAFDRAPVPVRCGFALTGQGVYFGSGPRLWRYRLP